MEIIQDIENPGALIQYIEQPTSIVQLASIGPIGPQGVKGETGETGEGVPAGGTAGQFLKKQSGTDYDANWSDLPAKQDVLVSGTNIKTVNGVSVLGSGNIEVAAVPVRKAVTITTAELQPGTDESSTVTMAKAFVVFSVSASADCRIRLYSTAAQQTADLSRLATEQPAAGTQHGVIMDLVLNSETGLSWIMSPVAQGSNGDTPTASTIYYTIRNMASSAAAITVNTTILAIEG